MLRRLIVSAFTLIALFGFANTSSATLITFDAQGLVGPSTFAAAGPAQTIPITIGGVTATFEHGVILTNTSFLPADQTSLYGTASFGSGLTNPLTITFSSPITNFILDVFNGNNVPVTYVVSDNLGNSSSFTLAPNLSSGQTTIGFAATGTIVNVQATTGLPFFDFFIDNIRFNEDLPPDLRPVPEPATMVLVGTGLLGACRFRKRSKQ